MAHARDVARAGPQAAEAPAASGSPPRSGRWAGPTRRASNGSVDRDREQLLFRRYQRDGDMCSRQQLVERYLPLARSLARRYEGRGESFEDLVQVASLGLVKAIDRFEPERELSFSSYAVPTMLGELRRYFRDRGWALHVPRGMQERVLKLNDAVECLSGELGRSPSPQRIAEKLGLTVEEVLEAIEASAAFDTTSLDRPLRPQDAKGHTIAEAFGEKDERFELIDYRASVAPALKALPERERLILHLRFGEDLTQSEIAQRIGVSQMHVSRLIRRALEQVRAATEEAA
jgi:RNA polymerase sigma-B factor